MKKRHDSQYIMLVTNHYYVLFNKYILVPFLYIASIRYTYIEKGFTGNALFLYILYIAFIYLANEILRMSLISNKKKLIERKMYLAKNKR